MGHTSAWLDRSHETQPSPVPASKPLAVETPGGGRIRVMTPARPTDLVNVTGIGGKRVQLHRLAANAWQALVNAARRAGVSFPLLLVVSGYRSPEKQRSLWQRAITEYGSPSIARKWVAPPGNSAHQTGRAIDFYLGNKNSSANVTQLRALPAYKWLAANAQRFGFYPYVREPWHWEYNPPASNHITTPQAPVSAVQGEVHRNSPAYARWLQSSLNQLMGSRLAVDGIVGTQTRSVIRSFQQRQGLAVDGIVGDQTERAIVAAGARQPPSAEGDVPTNIPLRPASIAVSPSENNPIAPERALASLQSLTAQSTKSTIDNALQIVKVVSAYHGIPWRLGYTLLEHEGGVRLFTHPDGVMQTTRLARKTALANLPRRLKLTLLGLPPDDASASPALNSLLQREFSRRLAVQIAAGIQELYQGIKLFNGYVALAFQAYNAGSGWAYYTVTGGHSKSRPRTLDNRTWEDMCRFGASLLHQLPRELRIEPGVWQCDANMPGWFAHVPVFDRQSGLQLIAYKYLRSIPTCLRPHAPAKSLCIMANHRQRMPGTGNVRCTASRLGALDKLYQPAKLGKEYFQAASAGLASISEDNLPIKVLNGQLQKLPLMSGGDNLSTPI